MNNLLLHAARLGSVFCAGTTLLLAQAVAPTSDQKKKDKEEAPQQLEKFVVIGSYIPSTETSIEAGSSPVLRLDRQTIEQSGYTNTAELLQQVTVANANSVPVSNNATGFTPAATAISLRGLGPEATLVLINGRRVAAYPVGVGGTTAFVDLNSIPLSAIENIEVLKDGASALYGADAVAGVINIRMRRGLDGSEAHFEYGNTTHRDAAELIGNIAVGRTNDKTSLIIGANYFHKGAIMNRDRAYSAVPPFLSSNSSPGNFEVSRFAVSDALNQGLTAPIRGVPNNAAFFFTQSGADSANNGARPASGYTYSLDLTSKYNFNEASMSYPEIERGGMFGSLERKLFGTDNVKGYVDLSYQQVRVENQLAPSPTGDFDTPGQTELVIPARTPTPILTLIIPILGLVQQVPAGTVVPRGAFPGPGTTVIDGRAQRMAASGAFNPFNPFNQDISDGSRARLADFGNRIERNETEAFGFTSGVKAENLGGHWNLDTSITYSEIRDRGRNRMDSASRFNEIVNANSSIFDPRSSRYVGTSTAYNPFGYYRNPIAANAALAGYESVTVKEHNESTLGSFNVVAATSDLWKWPYGSVGLAVGGDFRREELRQHPDPLAVSGDLIGQQKRASTNAQRKIGGLFLETRLPLRPGLEGSFSVRREEFYSSHDDVTVPKFALRYQMFSNQLTLRTSYSKGFREPSLYERFSSPISALYPVQDPRDGFIEPEQPITLRGNRRLAPERSDYLNLGAIWSPSWPVLKGLTLGVDRWEITRRNTVEASPQDTVNRAFGLIPGGLAPGESVFLSPSTGFISVVNSVFFNVGRTKVAGWDFSGSYQLPTDALGRWEFSTIWTLITRFDRAVVAGAPLRSVLGLDSTGVGEDGYLRLKGRVNASWSYKGFNVFLSGMYTDSFTDQDVNGDPFEVSRTFLMQGQVSYSFRGTRQRWLRDTKVTVGMRNLFDRDPPHSVGQGSNTTGYPGSLYTSENGFWYASVNRKF